MANTLVIKGQAVVHEYKKIESEKISSYMSLVQDVIKTRDEYVDNPSIDSALTHLVAQMAAIEVCK